MNKVDYELRAKAALTTLTICVSAVIAIISICVAVYFVTESNNARALEEKRLEESARKSKAADDLEAAKVRAQKEVREAEIKSKKRKIWERDAEGAEGAEEAPFEPGPEKF